MQTHVELKCTVSTVLVSLRRAVRVSELEFNVPFQHKHGYIRDDRAVRTESVRVDDRRVYAFRLLI